MSLRNRLIVAVAASALVAAAVSAAAWWLVHLPAYCQGQVNC